MRKQTLVTLALAALLALTLSRPSDMYLMPGEPSVPRARG